jgi:hypothetical protein
MVDPTARHGLARGMALPAVAEVGRRRRRSYIEGLSASYLVIDADVIFLRPVSFEPEDPVRFTYSRAFEYHEPYREAHRRLFGQAPSTGHSLVAHHMLYDRALLAEFTAEIERRHGKPWHEAYLDAVDYSELSSISEMESYGWWVLDRHPELARNRQLIWRDVHVVPGPIGRALVGRDLHFVAAHLWMRQPRWCRFGVGVVRLGGELRAELAQA